MISDLYESRHALMYIVFRARVDDGVFSHPKPGHRLSHLSFKNTKTRPVLSKGLDFAITPHCIPTNDILVATEMACKSLPTNEATQLRTEIVGAIKSSKVPKSNISRAGKNGPSVTETGGFHHDTTSRQGKSHSSHG